jgi:hypothetical protein
MSKLRKATIEDLTNKRVDITELLKEGLARVNNVSELLDTLDGEIYDFQDEIEEWFGSKEIYFFDPDLEYLEDFYSRMVNKGSRNKDLIREYKNNISDYSEEKQIEIFKKYNREEEQQITDIVNLLSNYDINKVKRILESEGY